MTSGVPQGTVLGPLLFLAFINDLPSNLSSNVRLFADDCVVYRQIINEHDHISLQEDLHILEKWQDNWQLRFNTKNCFVMRLTHNRNVKLYPYKLDGRLLESTKNHPYLGVCITDNLSWTAHINNITSSAYRSLSFIKRNLYSSLCGTHPLERVQFENRAEKLKGYVFYSFRVMCVFVKRVH